MFIRPSQGRVTSHFQKSRLDPVGGKVVRPHWGTDFGRDKGTKIVAAASGKVSRVYRDKQFGTFGNVVFIEHFIGGKTYETVYAHLASYSVRVGQQVKQGQTIAVMGTTGNSTGVHLHFEIYAGGKWSNDNRYAVNPMMYLPLEVALKLNDKGPNVKMVQELLVKKGYLAKADGSFGPATEKAVKAYQNKNKLTVDGLAGPATIAKLKEVSVPAPKKEADEMAQRLPQTQQKDIETMLQHAYTHDKDGNLITKGNESKRIFNVNHASKVATMTRGEATDLVISFVARTIK